MDEKLTGEIIQLATVIEHGAETKGTYSTTDLARAIVLLLRDAAERRTKGGEAS